MWTARRHEAHHLGGVVEESEAGPAAHRAAEEEEPEGLRAQARPGRLVPVQALRQIADGHVLCQERLQLRWDLLTLSQQSNLLQIVALSRA